MKILPVWLDALNVGERTRLMDEKRVKPLAESMAAIGLQQPITVWIDEDDGVHLVAGLHRVRAAERLKWDTIDAVVVDFDATDRELWEIDENLMRAELTEIERARHSKRRKELWETRQNRVSEVCPPEIGYQKPPPAKKGFAADTAEKTGMSKRSINQALRRAEKIAPDVQEEVAALPSGDVGVELDALADLRPEEQRQAVERVKAGHSQNIREAREFIRGPEETATDKEFDALMRAWKKASDPVRERFLHAIRDWTEAA